jgi:hypothetical protein
MLSDFLGVGRNEMKSLVNAHSDASLLRLNQLLQAQGDRIIQVNASMFNNSLYIFAFSTESHLIVPFYQIRNKVQEIIGEVSETEFNEMKVWEKKTQTIETEQDKFDVILRVTSGKNTKENAIKVLVYIRVASCDNSIRCANYQAIKRTSGCLENLEIALTMAKELSENCIDSLKAGKEEMNLDQALAYINTIQFSIKDPDKISKIKDLLKKRIVYEFSKNANKFGVSQALSYVGSHEDPIEYSDRTMEILQEQAFSVFQFPLQNS